MAESLLMIDRERRLAIETAFQNFMDAVADLNLSQLRALFAHPAGDAVIHLRNVAVRQSNWQRQEREQRDRNNKALLMADLIIAVAKEKGDCTRDDIIFAGFTDADIRALWPLVQNLVGQSAPSLNFPAMEQA